MKTKTYRSALEGVFRDEWRKKTVGFSLGPHTFTIEQISLVNQLINEYCSGTYEVTGFLFKLKSFGLFNEDQLHSYINYVFDHPLYILTNLKFVKHYDLSSIH